MKMASQRFCLRWNNHQSNLLSVFDQLLHAETFTDVTLAVEGQYLKAHKMVLSACSPYFNALFVNHPEKHPIVILKDVPYSDMKSLLDFMYRGEVSVDQERLTAFLRVAESLRIKGLTEVNDDKPSAAAESTPAPPQLQRIHPYLVPQQQQQQQQQQQPRKQPNLLSANAAAAAAAAQLHAAVQPSLLSSALMPKRKRGRPRKLSGSSNGTGNDYDDYEREGLMNDSDMGNGKLGNESYSGNDDVSDDNPHDPTHNDDLNESRHTLPTKRSKSGKEQRMLQPQDDNSTSAVQATPELSQRLFGSSTLISTVSTSNESIVTRETSDNNSPASSLHLPTILGLKIRAINPSSNQGITAAAAAPTTAATPTQKSQNNNSLLKQQLRGGAKDPEACNLLSSSGTSNLSHIRVAAVPEPNEESAMDTKQQQQLAESCSALQSLANAAERQSQNSGSNNSNSSNTNKDNNNSSSSNNGKRSNLHQQLLLQMAANANDYYQSQQQQQETLQSGSPTPEAQYADEDMELLCLSDAQDKCDDPDPELLTLADENAGLPPSYQPNESFDESMVATREAGNNVECGRKAATTTSNSPTKRPIQRRRVRRKAQSTVDDQAEHLTEMSVRGLDLFRYASVVEGVYRCTECAKENMQKTFKNKYSFQRHAFLYHEGKHRKVFPCPVCSKEFSRPDKMKNHLKMTHADENFTPPKDMGAYSPLKYLMSAAAAGDIVHTTLYQQQQQQQQQQQEQFQRHLEEQTQLQLRQQQQSFDCQDNTLLLPDVKQEQQDNEQDDNAYATDTSTAAAAAMLSLQNDVIIKNEIQISPSPTPSPPPAAMCAVSEGKNLPLATAT